MVRTEVENVAEIQGGFVPIGVPSLMAAWRACRSGPLRVADFRTWLACHEMVARRCHVHRDRDRSPKFDFPELAKLTGVSEKKSRASVERLVAAGLIEWSEAAIVFPRHILPDEDLVEDSIGGGNGNLAIPRRMLRHLVDGGRPAIIATVLALAFRCLSRRKAGWGSRGRAKAGWIARTFGLSDRQIKTARAELIAIGWVAPVDSPQWTMNLWGRVFRIDLAWAEPRSDTPYTKPESSHPPADSGPKSSPPDLHQEPLAERQENQEPVPGQAGVKIRKQGPQTPGAIPLLPTPPTPADPAPLAAPRLSDVQVEDLKDTGRILQLHDQAVAKGLVTAAEADRLRVVAAAERALAVGKSNPAGLFAYLVRNRAWRLLSGEDEDRANARIKAHLRGPEPPKAAVRPTPLVWSRPIESGLSEDARIVREVRALFMRAGRFCDPWPAFAPRNPGWDRARWDRAMVELGLA